MTESRKHIIGGNISVQRSFGVLKSTFVFKQIKLIALLKMNLVPEPRKIC